jgi:cell division septation protein DedD
VKHLSAIALLALPLVLSACASPQTHVMTGAARAPIPPDQVVILSQLPPVYEDVAILNASGKSVNPQSQAAFDKVIERLKIQAAQLGANAVILEGFSDRQSGSIGLGGGSTSYSSHSAVGVGVGGGFGIYSKTAHGHAVYIPPGAPQPLMAPPVAPPPAPAPAAPSQ